MIKEVDKRLQMLNNENYDGQFLWTNKEEIKKDVIEFFDLSEEDEEDKNDIEKYLNYPNGEYVFSNLGAGIITLDEALNTEFEKAKENIKFYNQDEQEEILNWFYDEVKIVNYKFRTIEEEYEDSTELNEAKEYLLKTSMKELREEIQELQNEGYIIDFVEDTMKFYLTGDRDISETHFLVCKFEYKQLREEFWKRAKAIGYIECPEYCVAIGKDTLGAEDVIIDSFIVNSEEEWKIKVIEALDLEEDEDLNIYGEYTGEGEYVIEVWGEIRIYKIDKDSLEEITKEYERRKLEGNIRE